MKHELTREYLGESVTPINETNRKPEKDIGNGKVKLFKAQSVDGQGNTTSKIRAWFFLKDTRITEERDMGKDWKWGPEYNTYWPTKDIKKIKKFVGGDNYYNIVEVGDMVTYKKMITSLEKEIETKTKKLEGMRLNDGKPLN